MIEHAVLAAHGLGKSYGAVRALHDASLALSAGRITAIVGENGAGKSTLARILAGSLRPDAGTLHVDGRPVALRSRAQAIRHGIGFVPQGLSFIATFSILENHCLALPGLLTDRALAARELQAACTTLGVSLPLDRPVERLGLAERQLGEIASAIAGGSRVLLLDEPTAALGADEIDRLVQSLRRLAGSGTAIGLVTHRIREVLHASGRVVVLRQGLVVSDTDAQGLDEAAVARLMIGSLVPAVPEPVEPGERQPRLIVRGLHVREQGRTLLDGISLELCRGEILGVAGVAGPSQAALAETLVGLRRPQSGGIRLDGRPVGGAADATRRGVAYVPEDRGLGLAAELDVAANASLLHLREPAFRRYGMRRRTSETALGRSLIGRFDIRPTRTDGLAGRLSGGNQQKLLLARELERDPALIVLHGPTQGLDLAAAAIIRAAIVAASRRGSAILLISAELDEILALSHRIVVLTGGRITARFDRAEGLDADQLSRAMTHTELLEAG